MCVCLCVCGKSLFATATMMCGDCDRKQVQRRDERDLVEVGPPAEREKVDWSLVQQTQAVTLLPESLWKSSGSHSSMKVKT